MVVDIVDFGKCCGFEMLYVSRGPRHKEVPEVPQLGPVAQDDDEIEGEQAQWTLHSKFQQMGYGKGMRNNGS